MVRNNWRKRAAAKKRGDQDSRHGLKHKTDQEKLRPFRYQITEYLDTGSTYEDISRIYKVSRGAAIEYIVLTLGRNLVKPL